VGDSRMRHAMLATVAFFRASGYLRGYANRCVCVMCVYLYMLVCVRERERESVCV